MHWAVVSVETHADGRLPHVSCPVRPFPPRVAGRSTLGLNHDLTVVEAEPRPAFPSLIFRLTPYDNMFDAR